MNLKFKNNAIPYKRYFSDVQRLYQTEQIKSFIWLSLSISTAAFFLIMAIKPTLVTITSLRKEIKEKREASEKLQQKIDAIVKAQEEYAKNAEYMALLDEALPKQNEFPQLALFFETAASSSGVELRTINFEKVGSQPKAVKGKETQTSSFNFSINVIGQYQQLKDFLGFMEASRRMVKIKETSFSESKNKEEPVLMLIITGEATFVEDQNKQSS
ncbi:hypothetical protein C4578_00610 [Candidatus Microgenomates bacterium]|jgi:Tfp pilus assembly protein PilO|nr:MAG: hypothetical protein C4578_00610 [Candidatus Microgenomates bacterium]